MTSCHRHNTWLRAWYAFKYYMYITLFSSLFTKYEVGLKRCWYSFCEKHLLVLVNPAWYSQKGTMQWEMFLASLSEMLPKCGSLSEKLPKCEISQCFFGALPTSLTTGSQISNAFKLSPSFPSPLPIASHPDLPYLSSSFLEYSI